MQTSDITPGLVFPILLVGGGVSTTTQGALIKCGLTNLLSWPTGIRPFGENFGSRIEELLDEPNDQVTGALVYQFIKDAISAFEDRITLLEVTTERNTPSSLQITLTYKLNDLGQIDSLKFSI